MEDAVQPDDLQVPGGASWAETPGLMARGLCMGTADVVPGVSGGTMALILGIYARLILAIKSIDPTSVRLVMTGRWQAAHERLGWRFLGAIVAGQFVGVVLFTKVFPLPRWVLEPATRPLVYAVFFGLVAGSIVTLGRNLARAGVNNAALFAGLAGLGAGLSVVNLAEAHVPETALAVFLCGSVAICAMILPGISGSFILLILGKYAYVLGAVGEVIKPTGDGGRLGPLVDVVLPFAAGCLLGLLMFARLLAWLLKRAEQATLSFMVGLMAGSLYVIWPFQDVVYRTVRDKPRPISSSPRWPTSSDEWLLALALGVVGLVAVIALERVAARVRAPESP